jgi:dolichyl-phosphate beta-glucosyltransferase
MGTVAQLLSDAARIATVGKTAARSAVALSIVVPAYNEKARLAKTFPVIMEYLKASRRPFEMVVVDDGSTDGTADFVRGLAAGDERVRVIPHEVNRGKGAAVKTGMLAARGDYVIFTDADLSTPIDAVGPFIAHLENGFDVVIGNRRMKESRLEVRQPVVREFLGRIFTRLTRFALRSRVTDQTCGFKGFTRGAAREVFRRQTISDWAFDAEILHIADRLALRIHQEPVTWRDDAASKVRVAGACVKSLRSLLAIWYNGVSGRYR